MKVCWRFVFNPSGSIQYFKDFSHNPISWGKLPQSSPHTLHTWDHTEQKYYKECFISWSSLCTPIGSNTNVFVFGSTTNMLVWCVILSFECNSPCQAVSVLIFDLLSLNTLGPAGAVCPCVPWEHLLRRTMNKTLQTWPHDWVLPQIPSHTHKEMVRNT